MGLLTQGYNMAMEHYRGIIQSQEAIKNTQQEISKIEQNIDSTISATEEVKSETSVGKTEEQTFQEVLNEVSSNNVEAGKTYNVSGYNITIPALSNTTVQNTIKNLGLDTIISKASEKYDVPEALIYKIIETESYFNNDCVSSVGATGLMQIMPFNNEYLGISNAKDPYQNIMGGVKLLKQYINMYDGDLKLGLAAYNAGPGNVNKYNGVPPFKETQNYIRKILGVEP